VLSTKPLDIVRDAGVFPPWLTSRESFTSKLEELFPPEAGAGGSPSASGEGEEGGGGSGAVAAGLHRGLPGLVLDLVSAAVVPPAARSQSHVHKLYRYLLQQPFFFDFERSKVELIARRVGHAYFPAGSTVISQGSLGDLFYMILHGTADVHVGGVGRVDTISAPYSFGDMALTSEQPRSATVAAATDLHALTVAKDVFQEVMRGWQEKQNEVVADFLGKQPAFASWTRTRLARLCARVQVRTMREGEVLAAQGRACSHIAIVRRGRVAIRYATEHTAENRWPTANETVEAALESAARCGLLGGGGEAARHVRIEEPGDRKDAEKKEGGEGKAREGGGEGGGGGGGGEKSAAAGGAAVAAAAAAAAADGAEAHKPPQSAARQLAAAAAATGLPLLPVPSRTADASLRATARGATGRSSGGGGGGGGGSPSLRDRGWGAGSPGGTLAFSPRDGEAMRLTHARASPLGGGRASPAPPPPFEPYFVDTSRPLPTAVRHVVTAREEAVGTAEAGAILCVQQCFRREPCPFTFVAAETGTQVLLVSGRYLALAGSEAEVRRVKLDSEGGGGEGDHGALTSDGPTAYA